MQLHYPPYEYRIRKDQDAERIFDPLRKKWVVLTPEEWVRQHFVQYIVQVKKVPSALVAVEKEIRLGEIKKRFDLLVYQRNQQPWMLVECKAEAVVLDEAVLGQLLRYHISVPAGVLVITNGRSCFAWEKRGTALQQLEELPEFK